MYLTLRLCRKSIGLYETKVSLLKVKSLVAFTIICINITIPYFYVYEISWTITEVCAVIKKNVKLFLYMHPNLK